MSDIRNERRERRYGEERENLLTKPQKTVDVVSSHPLNSKCQAIDLRQLTREKAACWSVSRERRHVALGKRAAWQACTRRNGK